jgi:sulfotransferase
MERTIHFVSGLPRSGSTLLCNLLAQNPRFHATSTSGILDVMLLVRNQWDKLVEFQATRNEPGKLRVLQGILMSYHDDPAINKPVVFDKSRGWLGHLEMAEAALGRKAKMLVCVRDVRDVLASFERLWRKNAGTRQFAQEAENYFKWQTLEGRCEVWMGPNQPVGIAYNRVKDALARGYRDRLHFVEFQKLTTDPRETMRQVYEFLDEPEYEHDFDHVEQVTWEDDEMHGIPELHNIRPKIEPVEPQWPKYLGKVGDVYAQHNQIWETLSETAGPASS